MICLTVKICTVTSLNPLANKPWFLHVCSTSLLKTLWGKKEIVSNEQFYPFPVVFSILSENFPPFTSNLKLSFTNSFKLGEPKICRLGKG